MRRKKLPRLWNLRSRRARCLFRGDERAPRSVLQTTSRLDDGSRSVTRLLCFLPLRRAEKIQKQKLLLKRRRLSQRRAAREISTSSTNMASASLLSPRRVLRRKSRITGLLSSRGSRLRMMKLACETTPRRSRTRTGARFRVAISILISSEAYMIFRARLRTTMRSLSTDIFSTRGWDFLSLAPSTRIMLFPPRTTPRS